LEVKKKEKKSYFFAFSATLPIWIVAKTAMMVTTTAYTSIAPMVSAVPNTALKIALIVSFHASAATNPKAAVINAANLSTTSACNHITSEKDIKKYTFKVYFAHDLGISKLRIAMQKVTLLTFWTLYKGLVYGSMKSVK